MSEAQQVTCIPRSIYQQNIFTYKALEAGQRPDMRKVAKELAEFILQNGFVVEHEPQYRSDCDGMDYRFVIWMLKPERGLP